MDYKEFVMDAAKNYAALPQETNELYRRHYIKMLEMDHAGRKGGKGILPHKRIREGAGFDAVIGDGHAVSNSDFITIMHASALDERFFDSVMCKSSEDKYAAFVNAHCRDVIFVDVPYGVKAVVKLRYSSADAPLNVRTVINVKNGASLSLTEYYAEGNEGVVGAIHEVVLGRDASAEVNALHNEGGNATILCFFKNRLGENSKLRFNSVYSGGAYTRVRNYVSATSQKSAVEVNETVFGSASQKFDLGTRVENSAAETETGLESKATLSGSSVCMLKGFARIAKGAEKSKSQIRERGMLLDSEATVDALPEMSVDESDVKATHSAATAPTDADELFYLMTKGLTEHHARNLIVAGFLENMMEKIGSTEAREMATSILKERLKGANT